MGYNKRDYPVERARELLEPGPVVLVSSRYKDTQNIMTMGWHTMMEFSHALFGCIIVEGNYSFDLIFKSKECVLNLPTVEMISTVVKIGNSDGDDVDKFKAFDLTAQKATKVTAPLIKECYANFECKLYDAALVKKYNFFIFEIVKVHKAIKPKQPETIHYKGQGQFITAGKILNKARSFRPENL